MKIPENTNDLCGLHVKIWQETAAKLSMQHGIYIVVNIFYIGTSNFIKEIVFEVGTHQFNSLKELRAALKNKAFL